MEKRKCALETFELRTAFNRGLRANIAHGMLFHFFHLFFFP